MRCAVPKQRDASNLEIGLQLEHAFNSVKRACYAGLDSVTLRREIVDRISGAVPFDAYAFSVCDPDTGIMAHTVAEGIPVALARMYVEVLYPSVAGMPVMRNRVNRIRAGALKASQPKGAARANTA